MLIIILIIIYFQIIFKENTNDGDWGLGIGDWDWGLGLHFLDGGYPEVVRRTRHHEDADIVLGILAEFGV